MKTTLDRRRFLIGTGALLSVPAFSSACGGAYVRGRPIFEESMRDEPPIVTALRFGITAPSAHNTQPWLIKLVSKTEARIYTDPKRLLPWTDPPNRQIHISHGTLFEMIALVAPTLGHRAEIELLPDGALTPKTYGKRATGAIRLIKDAKQPVDPLAAAIEGRRTSRLAHIGAAPTREEIDQIVGAASLEGIKASIRKEDLQPIHRIVKAAMAVESRDKELYGETLDWFRFDKEEVRRKGDGLNLQTAGADTFLARNFLTRENFQSDSNVDRFLDSFNEVVDSTVSYLSLASPEGNTMRDWLVTGRSYLRAQLAASLRGLRFHPVSQALQEYAQMDDLRRALARHSPVASPGKLQMLVRCGRTEEPALSSRRSLEAMMRNG